MPATNQLNVLEAASREAQVLDAALAAYDAAALAQFERDGRKDCGSCGGYMLGYKGNSKFAKLMVNRGVGHSLGRGRVYLAHRHRFPTQHMEVECAGARAFREVTEAAGIIPSEARSYVD